MPAPPDYDSQTSLYQDAGITDDWQIEPGTIALPVAATDAEAADPDFSPVVVVRVHPPVRTKRVRFALTKAGNPPVIPRPTDSGPFVFLGGSLSLPHPAYSTAFGVVTWTAVGEYEFVQDARSDIDLKDGFVQTLPPWRTMTQTSLLVTGVQGGVTSEAGAAVRDSGVLAKAGFAVGEALSTQNTYDWRYEEPAYIPTTFFSESLVSGGPALFSG